MLPTRPTRCGAPRRTARSAHAALAAAALTLAGCGSAWAPTLDWSSSSSSAKPLRIVDREPAHDETGLAEAEPLARLTLTFDAPVDIDTVRGPTGTVAGAAIQLFLEAPEVVPGTPNVLPMLVSGLAQIDLERDAQGNLVDDQTVIVALDSPLTLRQDYHVRILESTIRSANGKRVLRRDTVDWAFRVRDGILQPEELISFLQPIGGAHFLPDGGTGIVIEGRDFFSANFVIGVASAPPGGSLGPPTIVRDTPLETNQNGLAFSSAVPDRMALAWQEGRPYFHLDPITGAPVEPRGELYVSVSETGVAGWPASASLAPIDGAVAPAGGGKHISWPLTQRFDPLGDLLTTFWVFRETGTSTASAAHFSEYDEFGPWYAVRDGSGWLPAAPIAVAAPNREFGWPFLARERTGGGLHAMWGEAVRKEDFFNDAAGQDPERLTAYWLATFSPASFGWTARRVGPLGGNLPRPTDFVVTDDGRALVVAGSRTAGPRIFVIDVASAGLLEEETLPGPALPPPSAVFRLPNGKNDFGLLRATVRTTFPRLTYLSGGQALVPWKALDGTVQVARLDLARLGDPTASLFDPPLSVIQEPPGFQVVQGPAIQQDGTGALSMLWTTSGLDNTGTKQRTVQLSRAPSGDPAALASGALTISDPLLGCASGATSDTHPSGQVLFGWTYQDCASGSFLFSSLRRFE